MSKRKVPSSRSGSRSSTQLESLETSDSYFGMESYKKRRFAGVSLGGGKTDKTCISILEYFPDHKKVFLTKIYEKIESDPEASADAKVIDILRDEPNLEWIAFNAPLKWPKCMRCELSCPGYEECDESEIKWLWKNYRQLNIKRRPKKLFTPYTERCSEFYIGHFLEEKFDPPHTFGSNIAPLTARAHFLKRQLQKRCMETYPKLSIWRMGRALKVSKTHLRFHKHAVSGDISREVILRALKEYNIAFVYHQDKKTMIANNHAFESFICSLTAYLKFKGQVEKRPPGFPRQEAWPDFPLEEIEWQ